MHLILRLCLGMSHIHHQQQAEGDVQDMDEYSSTSHSSKPRSSGSNLIDVFSSSLNQLTSLASFEPYDSSYMADSIFGDDSYHPTKHLGVQHSGRYEDYHFGSDNHYLHNSSHTSHSKNIDLTHSCDYRSAGHDVRHQNRSGSSEHERGPGADSRSMNITSPCEKSCESSWDHYVHHEHSPHTCEHERGPGTDSRYHHKSGSNERDRCVDITSQKKDCCLGTKKNTNGSLQNL